MSPPFPAVLIFGPTGVGKTELLERLFPGKTEVINADSRQAYRHMDIGTAKPSPRLRKLTPHHLIDILDPDEQYNAGIFVKKADALVPEIFSRGKIPVISGGTAFYILNFINGLPPTPPGDLDVRKQLQEEFRTDGIKPLFRELESRDPESARRIGPADSYRIIRALEVVRVSGSPMPEPVPGSERRILYRFLPVGLTRPREELSARIDRRVDRMMEEGLPGEVKGLLRRGYGRDDPGMQGIGYREFFIMREKGCVSLSIVTEMIKTASRRYAKRQMTFFRRVEGAAWYSPEDVVPVRNSVIRFLTSFWFDNYKKLI